MQIVHHRKVGYNMTKKNFNWRINAHNLEFVEAGLKSLAVNVIYPGIIIPKEGDTITFHISTFNKESAKFEVKRVAFYSSFAKMFKKENYLDILPDATSVADAIRMCRHEFYGKTNYGVIVCQISVTA